MTATTRVTLRLLAAAVALAPAATARGQARVDAAARPNILWITSEDNGPQLGVYGDTYSVTPNLDRLARGGVRYRTAWSNAPVCAPARTAIITGVYPPSTGAEHMRSLVSLPDGMRMFPALLRDAGYYTANNSKEDYNVGKTGQVWDDSSNTAHWRNRREGQPFFAVFNIMESHESFVHRKPAPKIHDPAKVRVPAYMPDIPEVRADWAAYYDNLTVMDRRVGERLAELTTDGLDDDTIVVYFGDHGAGMPRSKRWPYNSGLQVPLIVRVPPKFRAMAPDGYADGAVLTRLVSFVDLAPTMLSLAGIRPPDWMQGHAFMGTYASTAPQYAYGFRGRMDERSDLVRSVRDDRYIYVRNYMPHRIYGQYIDYLFRMPMVPAWKALYERGGLPPEQRAFWETKPTEELYDLDSDPDEVHNLVGSPEHRDALVRLRTALEAQERAIRDVGFVPEPMLHRMGAPYDYGHGAAYDFDVVYRMASQASDLSVPLDAVVPGLSSHDATVRFWAGTGVLARGGAAVVSARAALERILAADDDPSPRIVAGEALARFGSPDVRRRAITVLLGYADARRNPEYVAVAALAALNQVPDLPADAMTAIAALPRTVAGSDQRHAAVQWLIDAILHGLR